MCITNGVKRGYYSYIQFTINNCDHTQLLLTCSSQSPKSRLLPERTRIYLTGIFVAQLSFGWQSNNWIQLVSGLHFSLGIYILCVGVCLETLFLWFMVYLSFSYNFHYNSMNELFGKEEFLTIFEYIVAVGSNFFFCA